MEETRNQTLQPSGATGTEYTHSIENPVPNHYGDPLAEYSAFGHGAALVETGRRILRLSGKDPTGMLNAILTNDVPKEDQRGVYATLLDPKGRVQADLRVLKADGAVLVLTEPKGTDAARAILGRYAPFSRVTVEDLSGSGPPWSALGLYGPQAAELLGCPELEEHEARAVDVGNTAVIAVGVRHPVAGYDLVGPAEDLLKVRHTLTGKGAVEAGLHAYDTIRVETGTPRFGPDITPENFPAEAGILDRAVSFSKGCYPGQETVARMHYRGHPNRSLHRLVVEGEPPRPGAPIHQNNKQVGKITSVAPLPVSDQTLALGYLHRNTDLNETLNAGEASIKICPK
ncbi:MAG: glycine cleavage T C-terminal barrel domain-containing protein [Rubrobacteraceae bacterium]